MVLLPCSSCCSKCDCRECQNVVIDWSIVTQSGVAYSGTTSTMSCVSGVSGYDLTLGFLPYANYGIANGINVSDLNRAGGTGSSIVGSATIWCGSAYGLNRGEWLVDFTLDIRTRIPAPGSTTISPPVEGFCVWSGIVRRCDSSGFPLVRRDDLTLMSHSGSLGLSGCADFQFQLRVVP